MAIGTARKSKRKLRIFLSVATTLMLVLAITGIILLRMSPSGYQNNISRIEISTQQIGGATSTNYLPVLADNVNWNALSADERAGTARYAVNYAIENATTVGTTSFSVWCLSGDDRQTIFLYSSGEDTISLLADSEYISILLDDEA